MAEPVVVVRDLRKRYGALEAVRGVSFTVERGQIFALVGPNGAGKTTTVEILEGYRRRTGGGVTVLGADPAVHDPHLRSRVGIVLQSTGVDLYLTARESVEMYGGYYPSPRPVDEVLRLVGLVDEADRPVRTLSGGQRRRLDVAIALAGDPELLFLDEPTTGFDPAARRGAWEMIAGLAELGKTVLLTTHYLDEAQVLASRIAVINEGVIVAEGDPGTLGGRDAGETTIRFRLAGGSPPPPGDAEAGADGRIEIRTAEPTRALHDLTGWALELGVRLDELDVTRPSLEDVYLQLTDEEPT